MGAPISAMRLSCAAVTLLLALLLLPCASSAAAATTDDDVEQAPSEGLPDPEAWQSGPDRETLVRFARAWGQISRVLQSDAPDTDPLDETVAEPKTLSEDVSRQVRRHIRNNGLDQDQWADLMARMEQDADFRTRVEMLAAPYQTPTN